MRVGLVANALGLAMIGGLLSVAAAQGGGFRASRGSSDRSGTWDHGRRDRPSFGGPSNGGFVASPRRRTRLYLPPRDGTYTDGPVYAPNITIEVERPQESAPQPTSLRPTDRISILAIGSASPATRVAVRPFQEVRPANDGRLKSLPREATRTNAAQLGLLAGPLAPLSGATLVAIRVRKSGDWTMALCWEDVDTFAASHPGTPLQAWFETADTAKLVVDISTEGGVTIGRAKR